MTKISKITAGAIGLAFSLIIAGIFLAVNSEADPKTDKKDFYGGTEETKSKTGFPVSSNFGHVILKDGIPEQIKEYTGFTVSFNKDNHTPNYVAWELRADEIYGNVKRANLFWQDLDIDGCPDQSAYKHSGYDRGHMCPSAEQKWSPQAMNDCFVMTNICPQKNDLNANAWETLENKERQWAKRDGSIWIIAGPIYKDTDTERIGDYGVRVPGAFFKAFLAYDVLQPRAIAFVYPNMLSPGNMQNYAMSIDDLEELTGYDFFSALPDEIENKIEAVFSFTEWNRSR